MGSGGQDICTRLPTEVTLKDQASEELATGVVDVVKDSDGTYSSTISVPGPGLAPIHPALYKNCAALNKKYPHGVGYPKAKDKTKGKPVTNFVRDEIATALALSYNPALDGDKDGIVCESRRSSRNGVRH